MKKINFPVIPLENVKGVLIDLDNTLYLFDEANIKALRFVYAFMRSEIKIPFIQFYGEVRDGFVQRFKQIGETPAAHGRFSVFQNILIAHNVPGAWKKAFEMEKIYWRNLFKRIKPDKNGMDFLKSCKEKGIPVCIVTNLFASIQVEKIKRLRLSPYIDSIVSNDDAGVDKPHPDMFETALKRLKIKANDAIMVGDNQAKDVDGAEAVGIKGYKVSPPSQNKSCQPFNF